MRGFSSFGNVSQHGKSGYNTNTSSVTGRNIGFTSKTQTQSRNESTHYFPRNSKAASLENSSYINGISRIDKRLIKVMGEVIEVDRLIEEDDSNYDAEDDAVALRNIPTKGGFGGNDGFYEDPYAACNNSVLHISERNMKFVQNTMKNAISTRGGIDIDINSFDQPLSDSLKLTGITTGNDHNTSTHRKNHKTTKTNPINEVKVLNHNGRKIQWDSRYAAITKDNYDYTVDHSSITEFETIMDGKIHMEAFQPEAYKTMIKWVEYVRNIGLYYLGAEQVQEMPDDVSYRVQLIFSVDQPNTSKEHQGRDAPTRERAAILKELRDWDPIPPPTEEEALMGLVTIVRIIIHVVLETQEIILPGNLQSTEFRYIHCYYSN